MSVGIVEIFSLVEVIATMKKFSPIYLPFNCPHSLSSSGKTVLRKLFFYFVVFLELLSFLYFKYANMNRKKK